MEIRFCVRRIHNYKGTTEFFETFKSGASKGDGEGRLQTAFVKLQKGYKTGYILCLKRKINFPCEQNVVHINTSSEKASACLGTFTARQESSWSWGHLVPFAGTGAGTVCVQRFGDACAEEQMTFSPRNRKSLLTVLPIAH